MDIREIFVLSFQALKERKIRSLLTILMVMAGTSLLVAVNGVGAGFTEFFNKQFSNLAPNILFVTSGKNRAQVLLAPRAEVAAAEVGLSWLEDHIKCSSHKQN